MSSSRPAWIHDVFQANPASPTPITSSMLAAVLLLCSRFLFVLRPTVFVWFVRRSSLVRVYCGVRRFRGWAQWSVKLNFRDPGSHWVITCPGLPLCVSVAVPCRALACCVVICCAMSCVVCRAVCCWSTPAEDRDGNHCFTASGK